MVAQTAVMGLSWHQPTSAPRAGHPARTSRPFLVKNESSETFPVSLQPMSVSGHNLPPSERARPAEWRHHHLLPLEKREFCSCVCFKDGIYSQSLIFNRH